MRTPDLIILAACFAASLGIGFFFSRRQTGTSSFFLGEGKMPGWLVGVSLTATTISAMTFLANPAFSFKEDLRWVLPSFTFLVTAILAMVYVAPFFRRVTTPSGYAYLEQRFGTWARIYAAAAFLLFKLLRLGVVLYVTCLSLQVFLGIPTEWLMLAMGVVATGYTMAGGFEAVVWTEFFQSLILVGGALCLMPAALHGIPGGLHGVIDAALPAGKMSLGKTSLTLGEKTVWVMILASLFTSASDFTTRQDFIQRYRAARSLGQARIALAVAACTVVPIWLYFNFLGTTLWAFYQFHPDPAVAAFAEREPEKIVPYFMFSHLPAGLSGFILAAILMASLSAMAPLLNACAVTWTSDFHQRLLFPGRDERYYLRVGRVSTGVFGAITIVLALWVYRTRTETLQDLHFTVSLIASAGLFGLFILGFFSRRTGNRAALLATATTLALVAAWFALRTEAARRFCPGLSAHVPDVFWIPVVSNLLLPALALLFRRWTRDTIGNLEGLTLHSIPAPVPAEEKAVP